MSYVFDSSSIYSAIKLVVLGVLGGNYTVKLAEYELSNIIWKEVSLFRRITKEEGIKLLLITKDILSTMNIEEIDEIKVGELAMDYNLTFYDASYLWLAIKKGIPLVSENEKLRKKAENIVEARRLEDII
jgi:predicted nucleic acid-binding protein